MRVQAPSRAARLPAPLRMAADRGEGRRYTLSLTHGRVAASAIASSFN